MTITRTFNRKAGIGWSTFARTAAPVPVFAQGTGAALFEGRYDIPDVSWKILRAMSLRREFYLRDTLSAFFRNAPWR